MMKNRFASVLLFSGLCFASYGQGTSYYTDANYDPLQRQLYFVGEDRPHTTVKDYRLDELNRFFDVDSVVYSGIRRLVNTRLKIFNNFFNGDFLSWKSKDSAVYVAINPLFDIEVGKDFDGKEDKTTWVNCRGAYLNGNLGKNFWFYCDLTENQSQYAKYYCNVMDSLKVVPGLTNYRHEKGKDYDYGVATGYVCLSIGEWFDFLIGKTKTFVGDGYRSLLLGDGAPAVPTFRMNVTFLGAKYTFMMTQLRATGNKLSNNGEKTKYCFSHFLDWNMGKRFTLGFFENVTQASWRKDGSSRGIDWEYLNPFIVFRPGEYNAGSPDKMLVGATAKFVCTNWLTLYAQGMLNEFRLEELLSDRGYWSNKYGFQFGVKTFNIFRVDGLDWQFEYNQIRPFCYSQYDAMGCYTHHGQSMGHPLGANLREGVSILKYRQGRWVARAQINIAQYGDDAPNDTITFGHNPNLSSKLRNASYGVKTLQGVKTDLRYVDAAASFVINPKNMMCLTLGLRYRHRYSSMTDEESKNIYFGLRWNLRSQYFDY